MKHPGDKIKVVHIITRFDKGGSAENTFLTVVGLDRDRYEVVLVTGALSGNKNNDSEGIAIEANLAELQTGGARTLPVRHLIRELNPLADMAAFFSLCKIIHREKPDIVHTHTSKAGILGRWAAWLCRIPVIIHTPHGHVFRGYFNPLKTRVFIMLERWAAMITDALVMLTPQEMKDHLALRIARKEKFTVIHSGVDLKRFIPEQFAAEKKIILTEVPESNVVIGTVGRLTAIKGQDVLIRAIAALKQTGEEALLVLLGEGERRGELEELAKRLKVSENICFLGWRPDVAAVMASFDIFCLPSLNEGMGKVIVEAMAMGLPIVASDIGGIRDLVRNGENGLLVPPGNAGGLAQALALLCRDREKRRRMGAAGRLAAPLYSIGEMTGKIDRLYGALLKNA
ncbi:MAG: glycosyltransferase family 4 protein [Syntrophales bacterium]